MKIFKVGSETELNKIVTSGITVDLDSTRDNDQKILNVGEDSLQDTSQSITQQDYQKLLDHTQSNLNELLIPGQIRVGWAIDVKTNKRAIVLLNDMPVMDELGRKLLYALETQFEEWKNNPAAQIDVEWDFIKDKPEVITTDGGTVKNLEILGSLTYNGEIIQIVPNTEFDAINGDMLVTVDWIQKFLNTVGLEDLGFIKGIKVDNNEVVTGPDGIANLNLENNGYIKKGGTTQLPANQISGADWLTFNTIPYEASLIYPDLIDAPKLRTARNTKLPQHLYPVTGIDPTRSETYWKSAESWAYGKGTVVPGEKPQFLDNYSYVYFATPNGKPYFLGSGHVDSVNGVYPHRDKNVVLYAENIGFKNPPSGATEATSIAEYVKNLVLSSGADNSELLDKIKSLSERIDLIEKTKLDSEFLENKQLVTSLDLKNENGILFTVKSTDPYTKEDDIVEYTIPVVSETENGILSSSDFSRFLAVATDTTIVHTDANGNLNLKGILQVNSDDNHSLIYRDGNLSLTGNFSIEGDIYHKGANYEVTTQHLNVGDAFITLRNATTENGEEADVEALTGDQKSGIIIRKYNGVDDLGIVIGGVEDENGDIIHSELSIGKYNVEKEEQEDGSYKYTVLEDGTQPVLTRRPRDDMKPGKFIKWNGNEKTSETDDITLKDISGLSNYTPDPENLKDLVNIEYVESIYRKKSDLDGYLQTIFVDEENVLNYSVYGKNNKVKILGLATESTAGLMSAGDKKILDELHAANPDGESGGKIQDIIQTQYDPDGKESVKSLVEGKIATIPKSNYQFVEDITTLGTGWPGLLAFELKSGILYTYANGTKSRVQPETNISTVPTLPDELNGNMIYCTYEDSYGTDPGAPPEESFDNYLSEILSSIVEDESGELPSGFGNMSNFQMMTIPLKQGNDVNINMIPTVTIESVRSEIAKLEAGAQKFVRASVPMTKSNALASFKGIDFSVLLLEYESVHTANMSSQNTGGNDITVEYDRLLFAFSGDDELEEVYMYPFLTGDSENTEHEVVEFKANTTFLWNIISGIS